MNRQQFYTFLENPASLNQESLKVMEDILAEYPYFQSAHLVYLRNLYDLGHLKFNKQLRKSSAFVGNRKVLYSFLHPYAEEFEKETLVQTDKEAPSFDRSEHSALPKKSALKDNKILRKAKVDTKREGGIREWLGHELLKKIEEEPKHFLDFDESHEKLPMEESTPSHSEKESLVDEDATGQIERSESKERKKAEVDEKHSFNEWLSLLSKPKTTEKITRFPQEKKKKEPPQKPNGQQELIDNFIKADPKIEHVQPSGSQYDDISAASIADSDDFVTDTLAKIYINQKHYDKALLAYEKLSLKYPEKSIYFADQIEKIKDLKNK
jgi:hypothetical protein